MNTFRARCAFGSGLAACLGQAWWLSSRLPERVASHFGPSGAPNGWMPRDAFVIFYAVIAVFLAGSLSVSLGIVARTPDARLNLPRKDYWLAPERRAETFAWLEGFLLWFGAGTFVLLLDVFHQVYRFNAGLARTLEHPYWSLGFYLAYTAAWVSAMLGRFYRVPGV